MGEAPAAAAATVASFDLGRARSVGWLGFARLEEKIYAWLLGQKGQKYSGLMKNSSEKNAVKKIAPIRAIARNRRI